MQDNLNSDTEVRAPLQDAHALIGCAGWSLPRAEQGHFPATGTHLERYASRFPVVEINSSFHRSHRPEIWARWRDAVAPDFRFSVKLSKVMTHTEHLNGSGDLLQSFLEQVGTLGPKLGCLLVQLPPSLNFQPEIAHRFFGSLRELTTVAVACEPRHPSWFASEADTLLDQFRIARVVADPARVPAASKHGGWRGLTYLRLHGSPKIYYSAYTGEFIAALAERITRELEAARPVWCIFDNTTLGAATRNALELSTALHGRL